MITALCTLAIVASLASMGWAELLERRDERDRLARMRLLCRARGVIAHDRAGHAAQLMREASEK